MKVKVRRYVFYSTLASVSLLMLALFLLLGFYAIQKIGKNRSNDSVESEFNTYKMFQVNPLTNTSSAGIVKIKQQLVEGEYISYHDKDGSHVLISNFGTNEYMCTGICFCEEQRKSSGIIVSRTLTYLVASVSSLIAYSKAKTYFEEECSHVLSDTCEMSSIKSDIGLCEEGGKGEAIREEIRGKEKKKKKKKQSDEFKYIYLCNARCLKNIFFKTTLPFWVERLNEYDCSKLELTKEVRVSKGSAAFHSKSTGKNIFEIAEKNAEDDFIMALNKFCEESSFMEASRSVITKSSELAPLCIGWESPNFKGVSQFPDGRLPKGFVIIADNPTMKCRLIK